MSLVEVSCFDHKTSQFKEIDVQKLYKDLTNSLLLFAKVIYYCSADFGTSRLDDKRGIVFLGTLV